MKLSQVLLFGVAFFVAGQAAGQGVADYSVTRATGITFNSIASTGDTIPSWRNGTNIDDNRTRKVYIGFPFNYLGVNYDSISGSSSGYADLSSSTAIGSGTGAYGYQNTQFTSTTGTLLALAPLYDDLRWPAGTAQANTLRTMIEGSSGNKIFTMEWVAIGVYNAGAADGNLNFQIKLYENGAKIEFIYGPMTGPTTATPSYTCGINNSTMSPVPAVSELLTQQTINTNTFSNTVQNALATVPEANSQLTFQQANQVYVSSTTTQNTNPVAAGAVHAQVIGVQVVMAGAISPLSITSVSMNTTGTTSTANLSNAKLFYTGTSPAFSAVNQFGSTVGSPSGSFSFTGSQSLLSGTNYFWLTYDVSAGATPGNLVDGECTSITVGSAQTPTVTAPAGARSVVAPLSGTKTVGSGGDYASLTDAVAAITSVGLGGNLNLDIISDLTGESVPDTGITITEWAEAGAGGYTLTIRPSGGPRTIAGNAAGAVINIVGANRITIDGRIAGTGRNLTISNANTNAANVVVRMQNPSATDSSNNITIRNCNITGSGRTTSLVAISNDNGAGGVPLSSSHNIVIRDNYIDGAVHGVYVTGSAQANMGTGIEVVDNDLSDVALEGGMGFLRWGILVQYQNGTIVSGNNVENLVGVGTADMRGIVIGICKNSMISDNAVHDIDYTGTSTFKVYGINQTGTFSSGDPSANTYVNNVVYDLTSTATSSLWNVTGINNNGGYGDMYYFNSVYLTGQMSGGTATGPSAAFANGNGITSTSSDAIDVRNNIFSMNGSATGAAALYSHYTTRSSYAGSTLNYNDLFATASGSATPHIGRINSANQTTFAAWQTASGEGGNSFSVNPPFTSATDLHIPSSTVTQLESGGVPISGITLDFDGDTRNVTTPDIGADEFAGTPIDLIGPAISYTALGNTISTSNRSLSTTITDVSGVAGSGNAPRIYYRKGNAGAFVNANATSVVGDNYTFTIDHSAVGGVTPGDMIQYYVAAQDNAGTPNGSTNPAGGSGTTPPGTTPPGSPNSYLILVEISSFPYTEDFEDPAPDVEGTRTPEQRPSYVSNERKIGDGVFEAVPVTDGNAVVAETLFPEVPKEPVREVETLASVRGVEAVIASSGQGTASRVTGGLGWTTGSVGGGINEWVRATPIKAYLNDAHSGTKAYVTEDSALYSNNHNGALYTPVLNLSSFANDASLEFWQKGVSESGWDGLVVEVSTDGGSVWRRVDSTLGTGPTFSTATSDFWHNSSSTSGPLPPPKFSDSTADYSGNANGWIKSTTTLLGTAGLSDVRVRFRYQSDGSVQRDGIAIDDVTIDEGTGNMSVNVSLNMGWNLISNPVTVANDSLKALYPNSTFDYAFSFGAAGYSQDYTLENGPGFWAKFPAAEVNGVSGLARSADTVAVLAGWNILGSLSFDIDTALVDDPGGIRSSDWFGYSGGYFTASTIVAGKGHWVKASAPGNFIFSTTLAKPSRNTVNPLEGISSITISDAKGAKQTLYFGTENNRIATGYYAMPPLPPSGAFDARFATDAMVQTHAAGAIASMLVSIRDAVAPVTVKWSVAGGAVYELSSAGASAQTMRGDGQATFAREVSALTIHSTGADGMPTEFALYQNYPNPFNPSTSIRFALPVQSRVTVEIFNALGQKVNVLVNDQLPAGYHVAEWNGTGNDGAILASGVYFVRLSATGTNAKSFTDLRKLMLLK